MGFLDLSVFYIKYNLKSIIRSVEIRNHQFGHLQIKVVNKDNHLPPFVKLHNHNNRVIVNMF